MVNKPEERRFMTDGELFVNKFPPGTRVWSDASQTRYGITVGGDGVYTNRHDEYVYVKNVDGDIAATGVWLVREILRNNT